MAGTSLRDFRKRIRSSQKTQQITKTMQMVAASRLKRSEGKFRQGRPYAEKMDLVLAHLSQAIQNTGGEIQHPFFEKREVRQTALVVITSDRGLCGAYNTNIIAQAEAFLKERDSQSVQLIAIGKKGHDYFRKRDVKILDAYLDMGGKPDFHRISQVTQRIVDAYLSRVVDEVYLLYSSYRSALSIRPRCQKFLNLEQEGEGLAVSYIMEPNPSEVLEGYLPLYVNAKMYVTLLESFTAENSARMVAMKTATDNAGEMIDLLTLKRNKARQAAITKEILEIVTAGEAMNG